MKDLEAVYVRTCKRVCELVPQEKRREKIFPKLRFAGINEDFDVWLGKRMILIALAGIIGFLLPLTIGQYFFVLDFTTLLVPLAMAFGAGLLLAFIAIIFVYLHTYYLIEGRISMVEEILPDFMLLVSSNINAGMTPFAAFRASARKEFGPLSEEVKIASVKSLGTKSFSAALAQVGVRINSRVLNESISFFAQAMKSGGKLAKLLETSALDLRQTQEMKKELQSSTRMYVIFVAFVIIVATPLLLAVSMQFLTMIASIQAETTTGLGAETASVAFLSSELNITTDFMMIVSFILLFGNALLAGMFIGVIGQGKAKMGLKYSPLIFIVSIAALFVSNLMFSQFLGI